MKLRALAVLGVLGCLTSRAHAQGAEPPARGPLKLEAHLGWGDPFGGYGLGVLYDRGGRFAGGLGVGLDHLVHDTLPPVGAFARVRLWSWASGSIGAGLALSREHDYHESTEGLGWSYRSWNPAYRATGTLGAELERGAWSFRLDAGIGYLLNAGECYESGFSTSFGSSCDSSQLSSGMRDQAARDRVLPSLTATVGYRFGWWAQDSDAVVEAAAYKDPEKARRLSSWFTLAPVLGGATFIVLGAAAHANLPLLVGGFGSIVLGLSYGPSVGYAYAGEPLRGWGVGTLRLAGLVLGSFAIASGITLYDSDRPSQPDHSGRQALGACVVIASLFSALYDVVGAPKAAQRENARHGFGDVDLVPVIIPGQTATATGLGLAGRF